MKKEKNAKCLKFTKSAIPSNRSEVAMPTEVREFAEMLAEIAVQQLRLKTLIFPGDQPHE